MTEKHEAILASQIIRMIKSKPKERAGNEQIDGSKNKNNVFPSLRSHIISMIKQYYPPYEEIDTNGNENDDVQSIQTAKNNMLKFFDGGVWVDKNLCIQHRFFSESDKRQQAQKSLNEKQDKMGQKSPPSQKNTIEAKKKLTFCPTYLITGQIFRIINDYSIDHLLLTGHFGIGKTYSFMLYHLLSDRIYRYLHNYRKKGQKIPKVINRLFPKLVYLSIDIEHFKQKGQNLIHDIIAKQCYELTSDHPNYDFIHTNRNQVNLDDFYREKNIYIKLVVDQIHTIASAAKNRKNIIKFQEYLQNKAQFKKAKQQFDNDLSKKYLLEKLKNQNNQILNQKFGDVEQIMQRYNLADQILDIVHTLMIRFRGALYLSSRRIQETQLIYLDLNGQHKHTHIQGQNLDFMEFLQTKESLSDIAEFFVLMLELKYKKLQETENISQKQKEILLKIKQIVLSRLLERKIILTPYTLHLVFFDHSVNHTTNCQISDFQNLVKDILNQRNSDQKLQEFINQIIDKINNKSKAELQEFIDSFLTKSQSKDFQQVEKKKKIFLFRLIYAIKQKKVKRYFDPKVRKRKIIIDASEILNPDINPSSSQIRRNLSKNIAYYIDGQMFYLTVNQQIALEILEPHEISLLEALQESDEKIYSLIPTKFSKGLFIEYLMTKLFSTKHAKITLKMQKNKGKADYKKFTNIKEFQKFYFESIPLKNSKNYNNFKFLIDIVQQLIKQENGNHLFMPIRQELEVNNLSTGIHKQQKVDEESKLIDFIVAQKGDQFITVRAFDVTTKKTLILTKVIRFFYELSNFQNKQQETVVIESFKKFVKLNYVVLIPQALPDNIQWKVLINETISLLKEEKQVLMEKDNISEDKSKNKKPSLQKIKRLEKRIGFLVNLSKDGNLITSQSTLRINRDKVKTLLTEVAVISYFDLQIYTEDCLQKKDIQLFKRLLEQAKLEYKVQKKNQIRNNNRYQ